MTACDKGDAHACANLGTLYYKGIGLRRSEKHGVKLFEKACSASSAHGCNALASAHYHGVGAPRDRPRAAKLFEQACKQGSADGCSGLGAMVANGVAVELDNDRAARLFEQACSRGSSHGCGQLALLSLQGHNDQPPNSNRALQLFLRACRGGDASSCMHLSNLLDQQPDRRLELPDDATVHGGDCDQTGNCNAPKAKSTAKPVVDLEALLRRCARGSAMACSALGTSGKVSDPGF